MRLRRRRTEDGAVAVEFALIMTFVLLPLVFGIIDFGFLFAQDLALGNASRQTARYGVIQGRACDTLVAEAKNAAAPLVPLEDSNVSVTRGLDAATAVPACNDATLEPCEGSEVNDNLYVTVTHHANMLVPIVPGVSSVDLDSQGVFRCEFS